MMDLGLDLKEWRHRGHRTGRWRDAGFTWNALFKRAAWARSRSKGSPPAKADGRHQELPLRPQRQCSVRGRPSGARGGVGKQRLGWKGVPWNRENWNWEEVERGCTKGKGTFAAVRFSLSTIHGGSEGDNPLKVYTIHPGEETWRIVGYCVQFMWVHLRICLKILLLVLSYSNSLALKTPLQALTVTRIPSNSGSEIALVLLNGFGHFYPCLCNSSSTSTMQSSELLLSLWRELSSEVEHRCGSAIVRVWLGLQGFEFMHLQVTV